MQNAILLKFTMVMLLIMASLYSYSQQKEVVNKSFTKEGVEFSQQWKNSKCFSKKSPLQLNVKVVNTNPYCVNIQLQVNYYQSGIIKEQSDTIKLCINPNKSKNGSKNRLNFSAGNFSRDEINSTDFTYEVLPLQIIKMRSCQENK